MPADQSDRESDLFPVATPAWIRHKARARRAAKRAHAQRLKAAGANLGDLAGEAWQHATEDFFQSRTEQGRLF